MASRLWYIGGTIHAGINTLWLTFQATLPFWFELSRDAANLPVYCFGIGLVSIDGGSDPKTVNFSEPIILAT